MSLSSWFSLSSEELDRRRFPLRALLARILEARELVGLESRAVEGRAPIALGLAGPLVLALARAVRGLRPELARGGLRTWRSHVEASARRRGSERVALLLERPALLGELLLHLGPDLGLETSATFVRRRLVRQARAQRFELSLLGREVFRLVRNPPGGLRLRARLGCELPPAPAPHERLELRRSSALLCSESELNQFQARLPPANRSLDP